MLKMDASRELAERIEQAGHVALILQERPDADAAGSACAMYAHLLRLQKKLTFYCASERIDERLECLPWLEKRTNRWNGSADLAVAFGCENAARLGIAPSCRLANIDHHGGNEMYGDLPLVDTKAAATSIMLYEWFLAGQVKINPKMATALYAGLAEAVQGFMGCGTDASVFETAAALIRLGAEIDPVHRSLFLRHPLSALRLKGRMLTALELHGDGRIAVLKATRQMVSSSGADADDCRLAMHDALSLPTVKAVLLLLETTDGVEGLLRSDGGVDVRAVAAQFGGEGAGFVAAGKSMEACQAQVITLLKKELE